MEKKLYVLISNELDPIYGCVQGGHAVAQYLLDHKDNGSWKNDYLIYLGCDDINEWSELLRFTDLRFSIFREPDLNNSITAIAVEGGDKLFKRLRLKK